MEKELGISVKKNEDFSEWFTQVVSERGAKLADVRYGVQGFIVHRPWSFRILRKIYELFEDEVEKDGHEPYLFPTVIKKENLTKEEEHAGFAPDVFWVTKAGENNMEEPVALRPTGETQIYPMYSLWLRSYNDLPFKGYQSRITTFRNEMATRPFIRGREFMFFEAHDVFETHEEVIKQVKTDLNICKKVILEDLKIPFMFFKRPKWDKFRGAEDTYVPDTVLPDGKRLQLASTHDLGQNFAKAYNIKVKDRNDEEQYVYQTCFGPGIWRMMAALIGIHGDDNGLVLPFDIAPLQIVIIPITFSKNRFDNKKVLDKCKELEKRLKGFKVKLDDSDNSPGFKYNQYELMGVPLRLEVGPKEVEKNEATLVRRTDKKKVKVDLINLEKEIRKQGEEVDKQIKSKAEDYFRDNTKNADTLVKLKGVLERHKGFVRIPFCSVDEDGWKCAEQLKTDTNGANVCGTLYPNAEKGEGKCLVCGKPAKWMVYVAKSY